MCLQEGAMEQSVFLLLPTVFAAGPTIITDPSSSEETGQQNALLSVCPLQGTAIKQNDLLLLPGPLCCQVIHQGTSSLIYLVVKRQLGQWQNIRCTEHLCTIREPLGKEKNRKIDSSPSLPS